jgi:probable DNA repair protein
VAGSPCTSFAEGLSGLLDALWGPPRRRPASGWAEAFTRALRAVGWPGEAPLGSEEYQATSAWAELLDSLARLDAVLGVLSLPEALRRLRRMAVERLFQPESGDAAVQVMGLLETPGQAFDALWVTGLHDGVLPAPLRPCPLIPAAVQREREMPRASPACELALARAWIRRLGGSAREVVFSWPRRQEEEPLRMSPVLRGLPGSEGTLRRVPKAADAQLAASRVEQVRDEAGIPVTGRVRGGTGLLRAQSACPFQAYARYRLHCEPLGQPGPGVDPMSRGTVLHDALRRFWAEVGDQAALARMDAADRRRRVEAAVAAAIAEHAEGRDLPVPQVLLDIEQGQAVARILDLLAQDLERTPFRVARLEEQVELAVGPLVLRGRVDRVDEVDGGFAVIDYKGGMARRSEWSGERPREPQMPVYALNLPDVVAVAFGCLKPGGVGYQGIARDGGAMGVVRPARKDDGEAEWRQLLDGWRETTTALAEAAAAGAARVDPRHWGRTSEWRRICEQCGLQALCRRDELLGGEDDSEPETADD